MPATLVGRSLRGLVVLSWIGTWLLIVVGRGNAEGLLAATFGSPIHGDAFVNLDESLPILSAIQSVHLAVGAFAIRARRLDVLAVLTIGPALVLGGLGVTEDWSDPNWFVVASVCAIGWLVGIIGGVGYWLIRPRNGSDRQVGVALDGIMKPV